VSFQTGLTVYLYISGIWQKVFMETYLVLKSGSYNKICDKCTSPERDFELTRLVVIGTHCIGSCKSNYHTITTTMAPTKVGKNYNYIYLNKSLKKNITKLYYNWNCTHSFFSQQIFIVNLIMQSDNGLGFMVFNATFNNISVISWWPVLLVEEIRVPGENHWPAASHWQTLSHNLVSSTPRLSGIWTHNVGILSPLF
jgi:hypothetical protein